MFFESCESRTMFSANLVNGVLTVNAPNTGDSIAITQTSDFVLSGPNHFPKLVNYVNVKENGVATFKGLLASVSSMKIFGGAGNDKVDISPDIAVPAEIHGAAGNDTLFGSGGNDSIYGGPGNDYIFGRAGNDLVHGNDGNDTIVGSTGMDGVNYLYGDNGNDYITGGGNQDVIYGGNGNDTLLGGGFGSQWIYGGNGDDTITGGWCVQNTIYGEAGNDTLYTGIADNPQWLFGGDGNDVLFARGNGNNFIKGDAGDDRLYGGNGTDYLSGGIGNDVLVSLGGGADFLTGNDGFDNFWCDPQDTVTDASILENLAGSVHRVSAFANGASTELHGGSIADPDPVVTHTNPDGSTWQSGTGGYKCFCNKPLFGANGPSKDDIVQGQLGDCYFLAALSATAKVDPNAIREHIVDLGDGTFAVDFKKGNTDVFYRLDADLPTSDGVHPCYAHLGQGNAMWVAIMEKAYASFASGANSYASIDGGCSDGVFKALGGSVSDFGNPSSAAALLQKLAGYVSANKAVTIYTPDNEPTGSPLAGDHTYTLDRVNYSGNTPVSVTLRNPWGFDGTTWDTNPNDGYLTLTGAQLLKWMDGGCSATI